jgi:hypothetical protein
LKSKGASEFNFDPISNFKNSKLGTYTCNSQNEKQLNMVRTIRSNCEVSNDHL